MSQFKNSKFFKVAVSFIVILSAIFAAKFVLKIFLADYYFRTAKYQIKHPNNIKYDIITRLSKAVRLVPYNSDYQMAIGNEYLKLLNQETTIERKKIFFDLCFKRYEKALELNPLDIRNQFNYLYIKIVNDKYLEGKDLSGDVSYVSQINKLRNLAPYDKNTYLFQNKLFLLLGKEKEAKESLDKANSLK